MSSNTVQTTRLISDDQLRGLKSFDDVLALSQEAQLPITNVGDVLGDGFTLASDRDKDSLVGQTFMILTANISKSDTYSEGGRFATLRVMTRDGRKLIINDGGTGVAQQVETLLTQGTALPIVVPRGLRASRYFVDEKTGDIKREQEKGYTPATTYFLDTASQS